MDRNYAFYMGSDLSEYVGKWVVIGNDKVLSSGSDLKEIYNEAKKRHPRVKLMVAKVPDKEICIY